MILSVDYHLILLPGVNYESHQLATGTIVTDGKKFMKVAVPDGFVSILSLQLPGKKRLKIDELLRGYHLEDGCLMK